MYKHHHKFDISMVKKEFERVGFEEFGGEDLYRMVEYVFLICACGEAKKRVLGEHYDELS